MPDYQEELLLWSKKLDIQISKFKHLYELVLDGQVTNVLLVNHNFYTQNRLSKLRQNIESELFAPNDSSLLEDQDETDGSFGNAILWSSDHNGDVANLIKGKWINWVPSFIPKLNRFYLRNICLRMKNIMVST